MKKLSLILFVLIGAFTIGFAQRSVTGTVKDENGEPIIGASVLVQGTDVGTVTDLDGNFTLRVPDGSNTLLVAYTGYTEKAVDITGLSSIDVVLVEGQQLDEVIVTALGIKRDKKALGYSVTDLKSEELIQRSETDPIRALTAKVPGVNITAGGGAPGQSTKINIRGFSSLTGNTQPLFVVDGIPFDNSVNQNTGGQSTQFSNRAFDIDPNNIESVSVLKGAAAAALYGSRATNGVILITTKSGSKASKGTEISLQTSYANEKISSLPNYQNVYAQGSDQNYNGGFIGNWGAPFPEHVDRLNQTYHAGNPRYSKIYANGYPEGTVPHPMVGVAFTIPRYQSVFPELMEDDPNKPGSKRAKAIPLKSYNFLDEFFRAGNLLENSLTIAKNGMNISLSRMDNSGIIPNSKSNRTSLAFGAATKLDNGLSISGNVNYVNTGQTTPPVAPSYYTDYGSQTESSIYSRLFYLPRNFDLMNFPYENPVDGSNVFYRALDNPRWLVEKARFNSDVNRSFGNVTLSYPLTSWLSLNARGGFNTYTDAQKSRLRTGGIHDPNGRVWTNDVGNTEIDYNFYASISKDITEDIDVNFIAGYNQNARSGYVKFVDGDGIIDNSIQTLSGTTTQITRVDSKRLQRLMAAYGDLNFGYKNFLYVGLTARNDWTSTLVNPKDYANSKNSYFYPSFNTSFILSDAVDLSSTPLTYAKFRASYAQVGNEAPPYLTSTTYNIQNPFVTSTGSRVNRASLGNSLGKPDLVNELTKEIEFGTDIRLFDNRFGIDFSWFKRNSFNQITFADVPTSSGFSSSVVNAGEIQNKGIELGLSLDIFRSKSGFNWETNLNFTRIRSLIVDAGDAPEIIVAGLPDVRNIHRDGLPYGQLFGTKYARVDNKDPKSPLLINRNSGLPFTLPTDEVLGDPNPDFTLGLNNTISFKGLFLQALLDWRQGGEIFTSTGASLLLRGQLAFSEDREAFRVVKGVYGNPQTFEPLKDESGNLIPNTTGITPFESHFVNGFGAYGAAETNIYDATVYRLREIGLGYELPASILKSTPFGKLRISVTGRNLWFKAPNMLKDLNLDPEVLPFTAASNLQGIELGATPSTRRIGVNLNVTF